MQPTALTFTRYTYDRIRIPVHLQQLQHLIHVFELFALGHVSGLAKQRAEGKSLADSARRQVQILLLDISRLALEARIALLPIDKNLARDHAHSRTRCQHIEQRRLARSGYALP